MRTKASAKPRSGDAEEESDIVHGKEEIQPNG